MSLTDTITINKNPTHYYAIVLCDINSVGVTQSMLQWVNVRVYECVPHSWYATSQKLWLKTDESGRDLTPALDT